MKDRLNAFRSLILESVRSLDGDDYTPRFFLYCMMTRDDMRDLD